MMRVRRSPSAEAIGVAMLSLKNRIGQHRGGSSPLYPKVRELTRIDLVPPTEHNEGAHEAAEDCTAETRREHTDAKNQEGFKVPATTQ